jgi:hypothetical protein
MVVRLVGENSDYIKKLKESVDASGQGGKHIQQNLKPAEHAGHGLAIGMRESRHAIHLLGAVTGLEHVTGPAMMGVHAYHLLHKGIESVQGSLGKVGMAFAGLGIGAAIAGVYALVHAYEEMHEVQKMSGEAAASGFKEVLSGSKSAAAAMTESATKMTEKGFGEAIEKFANPSTWEDVKLNMRAVGSAMTFQAGGMSRVDIVKALKTEDLRNKIIQTKEATEAFERVWDEVMNNPEVLAFQAMQRLKSEAEKTNDEMIKQANTYGLNELAAKKLLAVEDLIKNTGMLRSVAEQLVNTRYEVAEKAAHLTLVKKAAEESKDLIRAKQLIGLKGVELEIRKKIQAFSKQNKISEEEAQAILEDMGTLGDVRAEHAAKEAQAWQDKAKGVANERQLIGLSTTAAKIMKERLDLMLKEGISWDESGRRIEAWSQQVKGLAVDTEIQKMTDASRTAGIEIAKLGKSDWQKAVIDKNEEVRKSLEGVALTAEQMEQVKKGLEDFAKGQQILEGAKLHESLKTPVEKYADAIKHLDDLQKGPGKLSQEDYSRAVQKYRKEILGANKELEKFDAVSASSAEAAFRIADQFERLHDNPLDFDTKFTPGGGAVEVSGVSQVADSVNRSNEILGNIRELIDAQNRAKGNNAQPANVGG